MSYLAGEWMKDFGKAGNSIFGLNPGVGPFPQNAIFGTNPALYQTATLPFFIDIGEWLKDGLFPKKRTPPAPPAPPGKSYPYDLSDVQSSYA